MTQISYISKIDKSNLVYANKLNKLENEFIFIHCLLYIPYSTFIRFYVFYS